MNDLKVVLMTDLQFWDSLSQEQQEYVRRLSVELNEKSVAETLVSIQSRALSEKIKGKISILSLKNN